MAHVRKVTHPPRRDGSVKTSWRATWLGQDGKRQSRNFARKKDADAHLSEVPEIITRAFAAREQLLGMDSQAVASMPNLQRRHLERTARLSYLAPDIIKAILDRRQGQNLAARNLVRMALLPNEWAAQRRALQLESN